MEISVEHFKGHRPSLASLLRIAILMLATLLVPLHGQGQAAKYVLFNDGHIHVFPTGCISNYQVGNDQVTFTSIDGVEYSYPLSDVRSITDEATRPLPLVTAFWIDNDLNYQVMDDCNGVMNGDSIRLEVGGIGKWLIASFTLSDTAATATVDGLKQHSGVSKLDFANDRVYAVGYPGDMVLTTMADSTCSMQPFGRSVVVSVDFVADHRTSVPRIDIVTEDGADISSRVDYQDAVIVIDGKGQFPSMTEPVKVRGRGNTSWSSKPEAKNSYRLKFSSKKRPLGLPRGKNWVLLANKIKGSMLTNAIGMKAASLLGTVAANHIIPVDLYVNGTYKGNYNFTEKVGFSSNSIDLLDEGVAALLELDRYYDEAEGQKFRSDPQDIPVNVKSPVFSETSGRLTLDAVSRRFDASVAAVANGDDLTAHVDIDALARYLLLNELICNKEIFHPKSTYCYYENVLDDSSKLIFGPVWDLDWACGYVGFSPYSYFTQLVNYDFFNRVYTGDQYQFFATLSRDKTLARRMFEIMEDFMREGLDELCDFCHDYYEFASPSLSLSPTAYEDDVDYQEQATNAAVWLRARAEMIYHNRWLAQLDPSDVNADGEVNIADVNTLIDVILDGTTSGDVNKRADVNNDGEINVADVNALINNIIVNKSFIKNN